MIPSRMSKLILRRRIIKNIRIKWKNPMKFLRQNNRKRGQDNYKLKDKFEADYNIFNFNILIVYLIHKYKTKWAIALAQADQMLQMNMETSNSFFLIKV